MRQDIIEIRWHGRGGQGAITAAKIVANAAFKAGYKGVVMAPTFGTERRGAPISTSLKIAKEKIYDLSPISTPDIVVVLDHTLLAEVDVTSGLKDGGEIILNTPKTIDAYDFGSHKLSVADVTTCAIEAGLAPGIVNTGIIGSFSRATGLVSRELLGEAIRNEFSTMKPEENAHAASLSFDRTVIGGA